MISGYLTSRQDLVDLLNGCLFNKVGVLSIFFGVNVVSLYVNKSLIKGFKVKAEEEIKDINKKSLLFYHLSELMDNPQAFFTFKQGNIDEMTSLEDLLSAEELILQLQLVNRELKNLMQRVITPLAVLKVSKEFEGSEFYKDKSIYRIIISSQNDLIEEIRRLNYLISQGFLDIENFQNPYRESIKIEYFLKDVEAEKVDLASLLESFQLTKFTGVVRIKGNDLDFELYYKKGKIDAIYPNSPEIFELFSSNNNKYNLSVIRMPETLLNLFVLKHTEDKIVKNLPFSFVEMGKILTAMKEESRSGVIILHSENSKGYILYEKGMLLGQIKEDKNGIKLLHSLSFDNFSYFDMVFYQPMGNVKDLVNIFLINSIYKFFLKYSKDATQLVLSKLASSDLLKHQEGTILYRKEPKGEKEVYNFLSFLTDLAYKLFDREIVEKELEIILSPHKDTLRILQVEEYIKFLKDEAALG